MKRAKPSWVKMPAAVFQVFATLDEIEGIVYDIANILWGGSSDLTPEKIETITQARKDSREQYLRSKALRAEWTRILRKGQRSSKDDDCYSEEDDIDVQSE